MKKRFSLFCISSDSCELSNAFSSRIKLYEHNDSGQDVLTGKVLMDKKLGLRRRIHCVGKALGRRTIKYDDERKTEQMFDGIDKD